MPAEPRRDAALRQFETLWPLSESLLRISNTIALLPPQVRSGAARRPGRMGALPASWCPDGVGPAGALLFCRER